MNKTIAWFLAHKETKVCFIVYQRFIVHKEAPPWRIEYYFMDNILNIIDMLKNDGFDCGVDCYCAIDYYGESFRKWDNIKDGTVDVLRDWAAEQREYFEANGYKYIESSENICPMNDMPKLEIF